MSRQTESRLSLAMDYSKTFRRRGGEAVFLRKYVQQEKAVKKQRIIKKDWDAKSLCNW